MSTLFTAIEIALVLCLLYLSYAIGRDVESSAKRARGVSSWHGYGVWEKHQQMFPHSPKRTLIVIVGLGALGVPPIAVLTFLVPRGLLLDP
jgi:hypothetical protein